MDNINKIGGAVLENGTISQTGNVAPVGGAVTNSGIISRDGINPITSESLRPATPFSIPKVDMPDVASSISGTASTLLDSSKAAKAEEKALAEQQRKASEAESAKDSSFNELLGIQTDITNVQANQGKVENELKLGEKAQRVTDVTNQLEASQRAQANELRALEGSGLTKEGIQRKAAEINRRYAFEQADLALIQSAANRDLLTAQTIADRKVELALEPLKTKLEFAKLFYQENKDSFNKEDDRAFQSLNKRLERELETERINQKSLQDTKLQVMQYAKENGAPDSILSAIQTATSPEDVVRASGSYGVDAKRAYEIKKLRAESESNQPVTGEWASVVNSASGLVAGTKKADVKKNIGNAISTGDYSAAYTEIGNAVSDSLTGTNKTKFDDARTDYLALSGMRDAIKAYTDAGGDMGYLKGTADQIARNFGQLASDPKFASLAVMLQREFQTYRSNMSGAAFGAQESREYASVNPRSNASLDLNLATIDGAQAQLKNRIDASIDSKVPDAKKVREKIPNPQIEAEMQTKLGKMMRVYPEIQGLITNIEESYGRPITASEFFQAFPEYNK